MTSRRPWRSSTGCCRRRRTTRRYWPAARRPVCSPGPLRDPQQTLAAAAGNNDIAAQRDAADVELIMGDADAAFNRLIAVIKRVSGEERNQVRVRLLELFETLGNTDDRVLKARRALMMALF